MVAGKRSESRATTARAVGSGSVWSQPRGARELGSRGITTNVVAPGYVETDMTAGLPAEQKAEYQRQIPLKRFATPADVAATVVWLASEGAGYVTGAVIPVDGGLGMGH